jgi:hypothetical protein
MNPVVGAWRTAMTLKELLKVIDEIKKDLDYTQRLEERWTTEQKRFPLIYKYIIKQREFFQEQIDSSMKTDLDDSNLTEYVRERLGIRVERLKTAHVTPPVEEKEPEKPAPAAPKAPKPEPPKAKEPAPPAEEPDAVSDEDTKSADQVLEEAAAAAARQLREDALEASTQAISKEKPDKAETAGTSAKDADESKEEEKPSSRDKLRKLAAEVLDEIKKSK